MIRTIVVAVVLWLLAGAAGWALARYNARLDGKGSASQAPGSPAPLDPGRCGGRGPACMRCDREWHDAGRCEQEGYGWYCTTGQIPMGWRWSAEMAEQMLGGDLSG